MTRFACTKCKYKLEKDTCPSRCPYCSEEGTMVREKNAQELLDEADTSQE